jgi:hypothetical protein
MPLILNEQQTQLQDSARSFLAGQAPVAQLRALRDSADADGFSRPLWQQFAEMGFCGVLVPEAHGGLGLGHAEAGIVMAEIGRQLTASPLLASGVVATMLLLRAGSPEQQARWLPRLAAGERIATLAVDESSKHRPTQLATRATPQAGGWQLSGAKTLVLDGHVADALLVAARSAGQPAERDGISLFLVDRAAPGVEVERTVMLDAHNAARVRFTAVQVPADALLGEAGAGWPALAAALDAGRAAAAAELLGLADAVFERTLAYLKERRQFGQLIGEFQALQHRAAQLFADLEITRSAVLQAQHLLDAADPKASAAVAVAKARAGRTANRAVQEGVQMHGGMGMTDAFDIGLFMKRARVLDELWGDANHQLDQLALARGY